MGTPIGLRDHEIGRSGSHLSSQVKPYDFLLCILGFPETFAGNLVKIAYPDKQWFQITSTPVCVCVCVCVWVCNGYSDWTERS